MSATDALPKRSEELDVVAFLVEANFRSRPNRRARFVADLRALIAEHRIRMDGVSASTLNWLERLADGLDTLSRAP